MAQITRSTKVSGGTTLQSNTLARAQDVETDMLALFNAHNNHDTGTSKWQVGSFENATSTVVIANNSTGTNDIFDARDNGTSAFKIADGGTITHAPGGTTKLVANSSGLTLSNSATIAMGSAKITGLAAGTTSGDAIRYEQVFGTLTSYRRPTLTHNSATTIDVEANTGTSNQTKIMFTDGEIRTVTEDVASTTKYRRFDITATAEFTSGTEESGLRSGIAEATNTWYAIYAVKSLISASNFVLVGDTTLPVATNVSTLNSRYGTNSWLYLGMIRNGDNNAATGDIIKFEQTGNFSIFRNSGESGTRLASGTANSVTYSYSAGTGATAVPDNIIDVIIHVSAAAASNNRMLINDSAANYTVGSYSTNTDGSVIARVPHAIKDGVATSFGSAASVARTIHLVAWWDVALGIGTNPLI